MPGAGLRPGGAPRPRPDSGNTYQHALGWLPRSGGACQLAGSDPPSSHCVPARSPSPASPHVCRGRVTWPQGHCSPLPLPRTPPAPGRGPPACGLHLGGLCPEAVPCHSARPTKRAKVQDGSPLPCDTEAGLGPAVPEPGRLGSDGCVLLCPRSCSRSKRLPEATAHAGLPEAGHWPRPGPFEPLALPGARVSSTLPSEGSDRRGCPAEPRLRFHGNPCPCPVSLCPCAGHNRHGRRHAKCLARVTARHRHTQPCGL